MQIRDGPAAVRGVAPPSEDHWPRGREGGGGGSPESEDLPRRRTIRTPRGRRIRVSTTHHSGGASRCSRAHGRSALAVRVEGARGGQDDDDLRLGRADADDAGTNALTALDAASVAGEFYYHVTVTGFGPFVDQIGLYPGDGFSGWSYKVNGVSPPVGADQATLKDGDTVLWYWNTFTQQGGSPTLLLKRRAGAELLLGALPERPGQTTPAAGARLLVDGRRVAARSGAGASAGIAASYAPSPRTRFARTLSGEACLPRSPVRSSCSPAAGTSAQAPGPPRCGSPATAGRRCSSSRRCRPG